MNLRPYTELWAFPCPGWVPALKQVLTAFVPAPLSTRHCLPGATSPAPFGGLEGWVAPQT